MTADPTTTLAAALSTEVVGRSSDFNGGRISAEIAQYLAGKALGAHAPKYSVHPGLVAKRLRAAVRGDAT